MNTSIKKTVIAGIVILLTLSCVQRNWEYYFLKGVDHFQNNSYELAIRNFTRAIALNSENADIYLGRGLSHNRLSQYELAIADFTLALKFINDDNRRSILYFNRGMNYLSLNKYDRAILDFKISIEFNPNPVEPYLRLADIYDRQENWYMSAKYLSKAISIDPFGRTYFLRGVNFVNLNRYKEAIEDFSAAIELGYNSEYVYFYLSGIYGSVLGNLTATVQVLNKGIELNPNSTKLLWMRGLLHNHLGSIEKAIADFKRATELGDEEAREVLRDDFGIENW